MRLDKPTIIKLSIRAYNEDLRKYVQMFEKVVARKTYQVNKEIADARGISVKSASNIARKEIKHEQITRFYDPSRTDNENLANLAQNGINISISTLRRYRRERGIRR